MCARARTSQLSSTMSSHLQPFRNVEVPAPPDAVYTPHDIFLSHSGAQKGFVKDLYKALSQSFSTFIDIEGHSLPLAENFPKLIFRAAQNCKLAVVVLSEEFVCSRWPMLELTSFVAAGVKILPLFFKLSPSDLKHEGNLERWRKAWQSFAELDLKHRIDVAQWDSALQSLCSRNGLIFDPASEGEQSFLDKILSKISQIVPPLIKFDAHHVRGKDRLCKIILDTFEEMESRKHSDCAPCPQSRRSCVLGLYGMPGSGKSTLCKCLQDHFFPIYGAGKVLYINLPTNPSPVQLVQTFKELLKLTDFKGRIDLDQVHELEEVYNLLQIYGLRSRRVFLVVDNISEGSWEEVQKAFRSGFGPGSKVILVARTHAVLRPILQSLAHGSQCTCDSICIPGITEIEALQLILQTARAGTEFSDGNTFLENVTPRQREIIMGVVHMCGFKSHSDSLYLPLVVKAMGGMLIKYKGDVEEWGNDLESFWTTVETCKEDAVEKLIMESFKLLPYEGLRLLFLDIALFIIPVGFREDRACFCLSFIHESTTPRIKIMMTDLERHCFLEHFENGDIYVHDVYIEFAKSISKGTTGFLNWCWMSEKGFDDAPETELRRLTLTESYQITKSECGRVRTMVLEVGQSCERVDLWGYSSLKAVCVRNSDSLKVLGLAGLSSLVSLDIQNCASFQRMECTDKDYASLLNVRGLRIDCNNKEKRSKESLHVPEWLEHTGFLHPFVNLLQRVIAPWQLKSVDMNMAMHMRNLQRVNLQGTGITRLTGMSSYWPQLQDLIVIEANLEWFELGKLPKLQRLHFSSHYDGHQNGWQIGCQNGSWNENVKFVLSGKDSLLGCPELRQVCMEFTAFQDGQLGTLPPNLVSLDLDFFYTSAHLTDLSASACTLESLSITRCINLNRVEFLVRFSRLQSLRLWNCNNVVEVTGLELLPNLEFLHVSGCKQLQTLIGFENAIRLQILEVLHCPELKEIACLSALTNLKFVTVTFWDLGRSLTLAKLHGLRELKGVHSGLSDFSFVEVEADTISGASGEAVKGFNKLHGPLTLSPPLAEAFFFPASLSTLQLGRFCDVVNLDGIDHLAALEELTLWDCQNLQSMQGLDSLINLRRLYLENCQMLENVPSLRRLVNIVELRIKKCSRLQAVEGCGQMTNLRTAEFRGCSNMAVCPLIDPNSRRHLWVTNFKGCKFVSKDTELIMEWAADKEAPSAIRGASFEALITEYYKGCPVCYPKYKEKVVEFLFRLFVSAQSRDDDGYMTFERLVSAIGRAIDVVYRRVIRRDKRTKELLTKWEETKRKLSGKHQKKALLHQSQTLKRSLMKYLEDAHVAGVLQDSFFMRRFIKNLFL